LSNAVVRNKRSLTVSLPDDAQAVMAFSLRSGGTSPAPFDSLNFSVQHGDITENVSSNMEAFSNDLGIDPENIVTTRQVHRSDFVSFDSVPDRPPAADALITKRPGIFVGVKTADCLPILIIDPRTKTAAAIHAGWRGTVLRITRRIVRHLIDNLDVNPENLIAVLGPAIGPCCYEVDEKVLDPFRRNLPDAERFITAKSLESAAAKNKISMRVDLCEANRWELIEARIPEENVICLRMCTSCKRDLFFSYRRDGSKSGRHMAVAGFLA
jgi:polyphenol oxidase